MNILPQVAEAMQTVLTTAADLFGRLTGFVKRERKLTGSGFVQTVVFGWLGKPDASLEELTQTAASIGIEISPQGLDKRFNKEASECLKQTFFCWFRHPFRKLCRNQQDIGISSRYFNL